MHSYLDDNVYPAHQSVIVRCEDFLFSSLQWKIFNWGGRFTYIQRIHGGGCHIFLHYIYIYTNTLSWTLVKCGYSYFALVFWATFRLFLGLECWKFHRETGPIRNLAFVQSTTFILFDSIFTYLFLGLQPNNGLILCEPPRPEDLQLCNHTGSMEKLGKVCNYTFRHPLQI